MAALATLLTRILLTAVALAVVLLVFVVEPVLGPDGAGSVLLLDRGLFSEALLDMLDMDTVSYLIPAKRESEYQEAKVPLLRHFFHRKRLIKCGKTTLEGRFVYRFEDSRAGDCVARHLTGYAGIVQVDGYTAYNRLIEPSRPGGPASLVACWAHVRHKFFELHTAGLSDTAARTVERMAGLWEIEASIRGQSPEQCFRTVSEAFQSKL